MRSFVKCGIALPIDGSRDSEINITLGYHTPDLDDYEVGVSADVEDIEFFSSEPDESDNEDGSDNI